MENTMQSLKDAVQACCAHHKFVSNVNVTQNSQEFVLSGFTKPLVLEEFAYALQVNGLSAIANKEAGSIALTLNDPANDSMILKNIASRYTEYAEHYAKNTYPLVTEAVNKINSIISNMPPDYASVALAQVMRNKGLHAADVMRADSWMKRTQFNSANQSSLTI